MHRSSNSATMSSGDNLVCGVIRYNPEEATLLNPVAFDTDATMTSPKPVRISEYKFTVTGEAYFRMFQVYFNYSDYDDATSWLNLDEYIFLKALKQNKSVPGAVQTYPSADPIGSAFSTSPQWASRTIHFKSGRWSKKFDKYVGGPAPIQLSRNKCDSIAWCLYAQNTAGSDRTVYFDLEIPRWKQVT